MEKQTLLQKLKTLNQWQLQQQLHFAKLQTDVENTDKNSPLSYNKENMNKKKNNRTDIPDQTTFMQTMSRNSLTSALQSLSLADNYANISREESREEKEDDEVSLDNWHLSGLQTVKFMSTESGTTANVGDEFSDFDGEILDYHTEDGVKPFSETEDEEEEDQRVNNSQNQPLKKYQTDGPNVNKPRYFDHPSQQRGHQVDTLISDVVSRNTSLHSSQHTHHRRGDVSNVMVNREYDRCSSSEEESEGDNECTIIHNDVEFNNVRQLLIANL